MPSAVRGAGIAEMRSPAVASGVPMFGSPVGVGDFGAGAGAGGRASCSDACRDPPEPDLPASPGDVIRSATDPSAFGAGFDGVFAGEGCGCVAGSVNARRVARPRGSFCSRWARVIAPSGPSRSDPSNPKTSVNAAASPARRDLGAGSAGRFNGNDAAMRTINAPQASGAFRPRSRMASSNSAARSACPPLMNSSRIFVRCRAFIAFR